MSLSANYRFELRNHFGPIALKSGTIFRAHSAFALAHLFRLASPIRTLFSLATLCLKNILESLNLLRCG